MATWRERREIKKALKEARKQGVKDALCTECMEWYDSTNDAEVRKHAH